MKNYKDTQNKLYAIDSTEYEYLLPIGCTPISIEEANIIANPPKTQEELSQEIISKRDNLLSQSDWSQLPDVPLEIQTKYKEYRQALRDITNQKGYPSKVKFPELKA